MAFSGRELVGSVRGWQTESGVEVGRLCVASGWTRRGVASALMDALESSFSRPQRFILFTGHDAVAPRALYEKRGYRLFATEETAATTLVWLEKRCVE